MPRKLAAAGIEAGGGTPQQFTDLIVREIGKWGKVAKDAGIQPD